MIKCLLNLLIISAYVLPVNLWASSLINQHMALSDRVLISAPCKMDLSFYSQLLNKGVYSVTDYHSNILSQIKYVPDEGGDNWAHPLETLKRGKGDCEDMAFLSQKALKYLRIESRVLAVNTFAQSHAICVFKYNNVFYWFDNAELISSEESDLRKFFQYLRNYYAAGSLQILDFSTKARRGFRVKS